MDNFGLLTEAEVKFVEAHNDGVRREERQRIVAMLEDYFNIDYDAEENPDWDAGFNSAIALIKGVDNA